MIPTFTPSRVENLVCADTSTAALAELDNILVRQKEYVLSLLNNEAYDAAFWALLALKELWVSQSYGYKYNEMMERVGQRK